MSFPPTLCENVGVLLVLSRGLGVYDAPFTLSGSMSYSIVIYRTCRYNPQTLVKYTCWVCIPKEKMKHLQVLEGSSWARNLNSAKFMAIRHCQDNGNDKLTDCPEKLGRITETPLLWQPAVSAYATSAKAGLHKSGHHHVHVQGWPHTI